MFDILLIVLPVFLVIGLGYGLKGTGLVDSGFLFQLNRLVYYVAMPALLFYKIGSADFTASFNPLLLLGLMFSFILAFGLSYLYASGRNYPAGVKGAFCQAACRGNLAYVGLPIIFNAYGETGFAMAGILLGFLVPVMNSLTVLALLLPQQGRPHRLTISFWTYQFILNPQIIACLVGIGWSILAIPMPLVLDKTLNILSGAALPLALIAIGASISPQEIRGEIPIAMRASAIKLVWLPLLSATILLALGIRGEELAIAVILAGTPTATVAYIMAQQLNSDAELSSAVIMLSTLLSVFTFTVALYTLKTFGL